MAGGFPVINDLRGLPDPLLQYRFTLVIPNVPGGGDGRRLQYQCQTSSIPGVSTEDVVVTSHGIDLQFMGRQQYNGSISMTFYETRDLVIYKTFRNWNDFGRNHRAGTGNYKQGGYATNAQLLLMDDQLKVINSILFEGFFVNNLGEAGMDGQSSAPVTFNVDFKFDVSTII